jgi:hypothetical protein|tara:strand:+ start:14734 stop:15021 length:288 start_codon:yes stop_codon:yes gene_type:complete
VKNYGVVVKKNIIKEQSELSSQDKFHQWAMGENVMSRPLILKSSCELTIGITPGRITILTFGKAIIRECNSKELLYISQKALEAAREMIESKHYE